MAARYAEADLVICRAGALTVSELAAAGVASVLVPFPHAVDDHQTYNARFLADAGAAVLVQQRELSRAGSPTCWSASPARSCSTWRLALARSPSPMRRRGCGGAAGRSAA